MKGSTAMLEHYWSQRKGIAEAYWNTRDMRFRLYLAELVSKHDFNVALEFGCASGPNLYVLAKMFPDKEFVGIDCNRNMIEYGEARFAAEDMKNVRLYGGGIEQLSALTKYVDMVITCASLIYLDPEAMGEASIHMLQAKTLVMMELHQDGIGMGGKYEHKTWVRDYRELFNGNAAITKIPRQVWPVRPWCDLGYAIEVEK